MKLFFITFFSILFTFSQTSFGKINDQRVYNNMYKNCIKNPSPQFNHNQISNYCKCFCDDVVKYFTLKELIELEKDLNSVKDEETKLRIGLSNKKIKDIAFKCIAMTLN